MTPANIFIEEENISKNIEVNRITESKSMNPNYFVYKPIVDFQACKIHDLPFTQEEKFTDGHFSKFTPRLIYDIKKNYSLFSQLYKCTKCGHKPIHDPTFSSAVGEMPFILFHRSGVSMDFLSFVISSASEGLSFEGMRRILKQIKHCQIIQDNGKP